MSSAAASAVPKPRLVAERPANPEREATTSTPPATPSTAAASATRTERAEPRSTPSSAGYQGQILATLTALAMILSARALALLAVIGSFVLALLAILDPSYLKLGVMLGFDLCVLVPTIGLYLKRG